MKVKIIVALVLTIAAVTGLASAALLDYYGRIRATVEVEQSILVDNQNYLIITPDNIPEPAPGGENFYFKHTLTNQASIPVTVDFETTYSPDGDGITTTYFELLGYSLSETIGVQPIDITVEDGECSVTWTIDFPLEAPYDGVVEGNGSMVVGLIIALNGEGNGPAFQIHNNDGTDPSYAWGTWLVSPWGPTINDGWQGWHSGDTNTLVTELDWVEATGERYNENNPDGLFTITIPKTVLSDDFHWALNLAIGSGFMSTYLTYEQGAYPVVAPNTAWDWSTPLVNMGTPNYIYTQLMGAVTSMTIPSGTTVDFYIGYSFDVAIVPGTYEITTKVVPA